MILIVAAMEEEVDAIHAILENPQVKMMEPVCFRTGMLEGQEVVVMKSGVGKGASAMTTTIALERFPIDAVVNIGTAGGLAKQADVLDVVISEQIVQYDYDTSALDGEEGKGLWFTADPAFTRLADKVSKELGLTAHVGLIVSGDRFVDHAYAKELLQRYPNAICAEMEAGSIAQVCASYHVPYVILRSLSDVAWKEENALDFQTYKLHASKRSALFTKHFVHALCTEK